MCSIVFTRGRSLSDQKARDIIKDLSARGVCGDSVQKRLGKRAWTRPRVAVSDRLYKQYRVPDPWDPEARREATPIGLGPVSLRLGEKRREPAPHLKPRPPKEKKSTLSASHSLPKPPPRPKPSAAPVKPAKAVKPAADAADKAARLEAEQARAQEIEARMRQAEAARGKWVRAAPTSEPSGSSGGPPLPVRPDADEATLARRTGATLPTPSRPKSRQASRSDGGRFRMQSRKVIAAPVISEVISPDDPTETDVPVPVVEPPPRVRSMPSAAGGSMDDMFAAAAQMGRLSMRGSRQDADPEGADGESDAEG